jgi:hypothetical protein
MVASNKIYYDRKNKSDFQNRSIVTYLEKKQESPIYVWSKVGRYLGSLKFFNDVLLHINNNKKLSSHPS